MPLPVYLLESIVPRPLYAFFSSCIPISLPLASHKLASSWKKDHRDGIIICWLLVIGLCNTVQ